MPCFCLFSLPPSAVLAPSPLPEVSPAEPFVVFTFSEVLGFISCLKQSCAQLQQDQQLSAAVADRLHQLQLNLQSVLGPTAGVLPHDAAYPAVSSSGSASAASPPAAVSQPPGSPVVGQELPAVAASAVSAVASQAQTATAATPSSSSVVGGCPRGSYFPATVVELAVQLVRYSRRNWRFSRCRAREPRRDT